MSSCKQSVFIEFCARCGTATHPDELDEFDLCLNCAGEFAEEQQQQKEEEKCN